MKEKEVFHINGYLGLVLAILFVIFGGWLIWQGSVGDHIVSVLLGGVLIIVAGFAASSLTIVGPNEARVLTFFGKYIGTIRDSGLFMTVPLTNKSAISLRVRNFNSAILKVNDLRGNPVEIAAVIVFKVVDTSMALFAVDDYEQFVEIQSESAVRHVASEYPYDTAEDDEKVTLRKQSNRSFGSFDRRVTGPFECCGGRNCGDPFDSFGVCD